MNELSETRDPMVYSIDRLPDDIISHILSLLTVRNAFRARASSSGWLHLPDSRRALKFDSVNVFGRWTVDNGSPIAQSKFVKIVDRFMEIWVGKRTDTLAVKFKLGKEHASHIDRWVATSVGMKVEEIELNFSGITQEEYVFPSHLIHSGEAPYLKRLCLKSCILSISFECVSWVSNLTTLHLRNVPLRQRGVDLILSAGSNLITLRLYHCDLPTCMWIDGQLLRLKKLTIYDHLSAIKLNCPDLEVFKHKGCFSMTFVHVPNLRKVKLWLGIKPGQFDHLTRQAPLLRALSLRISSEVKPLLSMVASRSLKKLKIFVPCGLDLLGIVRLLNASPFLEILRLKLCWRSYKVQIKKGEYRDLRHFKLKEVEIDRFFNRWNVMELAMHILKNAVALERMVIKVTEADGLREKVMPLQQLQEKANPNAQVIIV